MGSLVGLLLEWTKESGVDTQAVRHRMRVVGITAREKNSPNVWRWQQRNEWAASLPRSVLRGVSVPSRLWDYLGNWQKKVARTNPRSRWADDEMQLPPRQVEHAEALRLALQLHELARTREEREIFSSSLAAETAMRHAWFRRLVSEVRLGRDR